MNRSLSLSLSLSRALSRALPCVLLSLTAVACGEASFGDASASAAVTSGDDLSVRLEALPAFASLPQPQQRALLRTISRKANPISLGLREALEALLAAEVPPTSAQLGGLLTSGWDFTRCTNTRPAPMAPCPGVLPPQGQATAAIRLAGNPTTIGEGELGDRPISPTPLDEAAFEAKAIKLAQSLPVSFSAADFIEGQVEPGATFGVTIGGVTTTITAPPSPHGVPTLDEHFQAPGDPDSAGKPLVLRSVREVAQAIANLPAAVLPFVKSVNLRGERSPYDRGFGIAYGRPINVGNPHPMRAYAMAVLHPLETFEVFPRPTDDDAPPEDLVNTLAHETGHTWTYVQFGTDLASAGWQEWLAAKNDDAIAPSTYANSSIIDDGAETVLVYLAALSQGGPGTEIYEDMKTLFPARWAILEAKFPR